MATLNQVCENCREAIDSVFSASPRPSEIISGDFLFNKCCFVRDEIRFLDPGRLIFTPNQEKDGYCDEYFVICRKLIIVGGGEPGTLDPCGTEDPGNIYKNKNAITWKDRLEINSSSNPSPIDAADGANFGGWQDQGRGIAAKRATKAPTAKGAPRELRAWTLPISLLWLWRSSSWDSTRTSSSTSTDRSEAPDSAARTAARAARA